MERTEEVTNEAEERTGESTLGTEKGGACTNPAKHQAEIKKGEEEGEVT